MARSILIILFVLVVGLSYTTDSLARGSYVFNRALKEELKGNLEKAYSIMKEEYDKKPNNPQTKSEFQNFQKALVKKYLSQADILPQHDLPAKRLMLIKAKEIDQTDTEVISRIDKIDKEIEHVDKQAKDGISGSILNSCRVFCAIKDYEPYFSNVKNLKTKIDKSKVEIVEEVNSIISSGKEKDIVKAFSTTMGLFPDDDLMRSSLEIFLKEKAKSLIPISEEFYNANRLATSIFYLLVSRSYSEGMIDLDKKIRDRLTEFDNKHKSNVKINFSNSFSTNQKDEILNALKAHEGSNSTYKINNSEKISASDILISLNLRDLSIKTKPCESAKESKYLSGYQNVPNPAYNNLILAYNQAQTNVASASQNYAYNPNFINAFAKGLAQGQLNNVASQLVATPQYVQEPVYQNYLYQQTDYRHSLHIEISYEILNVASGYLISKGKAEETKEETTIAINGAHPSDSCGVVNKQVSESDAQDILSRFSKINMQTLSETIVKFLEKKHLYIARDLFAKQKYGKTINEVLTYEMLVALKNPDCVKNKKWQIDEFLHILDIPKGKYVIKDMVSINDSSVDLSIKSRLRVSMSNSRMLPEEFADLKNAAKYFNSEKVFYEEENRPLQAIKGLGSISSLSNIMDIAKPATMLGKISLDSSVRMMNLMASSISAVKRQPKNIIEKCLESVVVIDIPSGGGSGFVVNKKGYVVTNYHVIADQRDIIIKTKEGKKFFADLIEVAKYKDLALLRINTREVPCLRIGNTKKISSGDTVYALGSPGGLEQSVTKGVVSAIRLLDAPYNPLTKIEIIQTDAALNPGNSGGPLVNEKGEVIAVNSQKIVATDVEGINFSISIDEVKKSFAKYL